MTSVQAPVPRLSPLPPDPSLADIYAMFDCIGAIVPNAIYIMQRKPKILRAYVQLMAAVSDPETSEVDAGLKHLIAHVASRAGGCRYCMAHTAGLALATGVEEAKLMAVWEYCESPLYSEAERVALDVALAGGTVPNGVTDAMFAALRGHWSDGEIVEIVAMVAFFGFLNRWNDTLATPIENEALLIGQKHLADQGWDPGKHLRDR